MAEPICICRRIELGREFHNDACKAYTAGWNAALEQIGDARTEMEALETAQQLMVTQFRTMQAEKEHGWREAERWEGRYEALAAAVLAIHRPTQVWTDTVVDDDGERETALYDADERLVAATDIRTVCDGCDIPREIPWPCPTARAVGVTG